MSDLLSPHFSLRELTYSSRAKAMAIENSPADWQIENLQRLCASVLEPIRELFGMPVVVSSGYRCADLNAAVGGKSNSAHLDGRAADFQVAGYNAIEAFKVIVNTKHIMFDQLIHETSPMGISWLHVSVPLLGSHPRQQTLILEAK